MRPNSCVTERGRNNTKIVKDLPCLHQLLPQDSGELARNIELLIGHESVAVKLFCICIILEKAPNGVSLPGVSANYWFINVLN